MDAKFLQRVLSTVEAHLESRPSQGEFELAYQARTACDRIRFAIKSTEECGVHSPQVREANLQLLDALDRLESAELHFQERFHLRRGTCTDTKTSVGKQNGHSAVATQ